MNEWNAYRVNQWILHWAITQTHTRTACARIVFAAFVFYLFLCVCVFFFLSMPSQSSEWTNMCVCVCLSLWVINVYLPHSSGRVPFYSSAATITNSFYTENCIHSRSFVFALCCLCHITSVCAVAVFVFRLKSRAHGKRNEKTAHTKKNCMNHMKNWDADKQRQRKTERNVVESCGGAIHSGKMDILVLLCNCQVCLCVF